MVYHAQRSYYEQLLATGVKIWMYKKPYILHSKSMSIDDEEVSTGTGAACLGDPVNAVQWLARYALDFGEPLRAGQLILSGALGPMRPIAAGNTVRSTVSGLGSVAFTAGD